MKTVLITGASGFIAGRLAAKLAEKGMRVVGTSRSMTTRAHFVRVYQASLGDSLAAVFSDESIEAVVHTANYVGTDEYGVNYRGTKRWFEEAVEAGVGLQILLSSLSAGPAALSGYGRSKFALEDLFASREQVSFRCGVVVGDGGMFARIRKSVASGPLVPLLDGGSARVYLLDVDSLCEILNDCISRNGEGMRDRVWSIQQPAPVTLRALMEAIRERHGYRCWFVPVPSLPVLWALTLAEKLPISLPVSATNVRGLRQSRSESFGSDYAHFGYREYTLEELVDRAATGDGAQFR